MTTILVLEDHRPLREEIVAMLLFENFGVLETDNGLDGVQLAREHLPDLIISDIMMPNLDGYAVLRELRNDSATARIPFVFLTAKSAREDRRKGMELGADDYLTKPVTPDELLVVIRARLEKQQKVEYEELRRFSHQLVNIQENERRQLARTLRDEIAQVLAGLQVTLEMSKYLPSTALRLTFDEIQELVDALLKQIDTLALDLWPTMLDHLGLLPALLWQFDRFSVQSQMKIDFEHAGLERSFSPKVKLGAYRIMQEALLNIARHADVSEASVRIWVDDDLLSVEVADQGVGFDLENVLITGETRGLIAIRERTLALGGELTITSTPGSGTNLILRLPLEASNQRQPDRDMHMPDMKPILNTSRSSLGSERSPTTPGDRHPKPGSPASVREVTIILAHKLEFVRRGLHSVLVTEPGFSIVGEASHGLETLDQVERLNPDVLVLDLHISGISGLDITRQVSQRASQTRVIVISMYDQEAYVLEALRSGATGYIFKDSSAHDLIEAIHEVVAGRQYLSSPLSERALETYASARKSKHASLDSYSILTNREREVLHLVVEGHTNAQIAEELSISPRTAETHRANMMRKLGLRKQSDLIHYALQRGLVSLDSST